MAGKSGIYSNIIIYDERRRYYYLWAQRNRPLLDDEVRHIGIGQLDQTRRAVQHVYGDVAVPYNVYASSAISTINAFKVVASGSPSKNFVLTGGTAGGDSLDHPAALYAKGFYIFFTGDIEYKQQMYASENIDLNTEADKYKTLTAIPALTTPSTDRTDIVYLHLHFEQVSSESGPDLDVYRDTGLKNPVVGTDTANRLRAVFDIRVYEGWAGTITSDIFNDVEFLGGIPGNDSLPTDNDYKVPIAVIYRKAYQDNINNDEIVDLLTLYNKRVHTLEEVAYRLRHGGYTQADVDEKGFTGFQAQYPGAIVDEGAFATGLNEGIDTEAFNTDAVTPRVVDKSGKFFMQGLQVGHETGIVTYETGPEMLNEGEIVAKQESLESLYVGYDKGYTGIDAPTGTREYKDNVNIYAKGTSGTVGLAMISEDGETGAQMVYMESIRDRQVENFFSMDYKGRVGLNTTRPGWAGPDPKWGLTGTNIVFDVNDALQVQDLFVEGDAYFDGAIQGQTWNIPAQISDLNPVLFGFSGTVDGSGLTGAIAAFIVKRGIAVAGVTGVSGYGYTGVGGYECYDYNGQRLFTIGDLGEEFDRVVMSLYGIGQREAYLSDYSFLMLPGLGSVQASDTVNYDVTLENGNHVTGLVTLTQNGMDAVEELRDDIMHSSSWGAPTGLYRDFSYTYYGVTGIDSPVVQTRYGQAYGVQILQNLYGYTGAGFTGAPDDSHGKLIIKEMPEDPVAVSIQTVNSMVVTRGVNTVSVPYTQTHYYGSTQYGGNVLDMRFAKLDLGEAADAWLFNGDVFFNGGGMLNRVTFSTDAIFRDDVFMYGTLFADELRFNFARVGNLGIDNDLIVDKIGHFIDGIAAGVNALTDLTTLQTSNANLLFYAKGDIQAQNLIAQSESTDEAVLGSAYFKSKVNGGKAYARIGGAINSATDPFGFHLVDDRGGVSLDSATSFKNLVLDYSDGNGNYGDLNLALRGDLTLSNGLMATYLGAGVTGINTDYALDVDGRARVAGILEVETLRFIGAVAPEGDTDILTPGNVTVIDNGDETAHNNSEILRDKKFTVTERVYLNNEGKLDYAPGLGETGTRGEYYTAMHAGSQAYWGHDTLTYEERDFSTLVGTGNEIIVSEVTNTAFQRYKCNRIIVATLGTLKIDWTGYAYDPTDNVDQDDVIQSYYFESPYFRNREGGSVINWMPGSGRFGDENLIVHVEGNIIDTHASYPNMYTIEKAIALYVPKNQWWGYAKGQPEAPDVHYKTVMLWYPYRNISANLNELAFTNQTLCAGGFQPYTDWRLAIYPRLVKHRRLPFDQTAGSNAERMYQGEWDLDLVILPTAIGRCSNLIGKLYVSYMQS